MVHTMHVSGVRHLLKSCTRFRNQFDFQLISVISIWNTILDKNITSNIYNVKGVISGCMWCDMAKCVEICDLSDGNVNCYWWKCEMLLVECELLLVEM